MVDINIRTGRFRGLGLVYNLKDDLDLFFLFTNEYETIGINLDGCSYDRTVQNLKDLITKADNKLDELLKYGQKKGGAK